MFRGAEAALKANDCERYYATHGASRIDMRRNALRYRAYALMRIEDIGGKRKRNHV